MSPPTELSFDEILKFMLAHNGKVTNHELVKHFKVFLMNPDMRDQARSTFKKHVNSLAIIKNQNNEKWLILKKKYMVNSGKESDEQTETKIEDPPAPECSEPSPDPPVQPPYRPPPLLQLNQDFNILNNIIQVSTPITSPLTPVELTQSDSKESLESEDVPPKVHPRRRSSEKSATPTVQSHNLNPRSSIPNSTTELNETPLTTSRSESMLVESEQKISVKERKQMFNRMASESDVLKSQKLSFNSSSVDEEDRASLDHKENDPLDPKQKQWILCAARGEYHALAKMCKENAKLVRTKNNMPFKIIECIEKGQKRLCIVPSLWETNGELRWPRKRLEVNKLVKDENSRPLDNWSTSKCCVKRSSISSYEEAMRELDVMVQNSDTEIDTVTETNARDNTNIDFNALAGQFDPFTGTAMHWACKRGDENLVKLLAGVHRHIVNERSNGGYTPLHIAMQFRHENVYRLLVEVYDADPNVRDWSGKKPRQYLVHMDTSLSPGSYRKKEGFLRIGSLNVRVKKTTEAFSNFLGVGATRASAYVPKSARERELDRRSDDSDQLKSWGSADNIQKGEKLMPPPSSKARRRGPNGRRAHPSHSRSTPSTPDQPRAQIGVNSAESDSDSAAGFHSAWRQQRASQS